MALRSEEIDDSFYSRQRYVIGDNAMVRLSNSTVLICGLGGVGIEIAKNLVLAGVKELILDDSTICSVGDLATQFYIRPEDVDQRRTRAEASRHCLEKLNPYVVVSIKTNFLTTPSVGVIQQLNSLSMCDVQCIVLTDCHLFFAALLNNYCRQHHIKFVYANSFGVFGNVFCDFGHEIEFGPPDEEPPESFFIESIENAEKPKLVIKGLGQHKIPDRGLLTFHEVSGMVELNNKTVEVRDLSPRTLELNIDTRSFGKFAGDGLATEVKRSHKISHFTLAQQLENPKICTTDLVNPDSSLQMHVAFLTLMAFIYARRRFPKAWGKKDSKMFCKLAKRFRIPGMEIDLVFMEKMSFTFRGHLAPLCSFFGGVAAQEVIKAVTESFTPLNQWVYLGVDSLVPSHFQNASEHSINSRYGPLVTCIGARNMERLAKASAFMVGCGAIGCELLKNLALLGFASEASKPFVAKVSSNNSNYATSSPSNDEASISTSRSEDDEDDEEELAPLIIRDIHQMATQLTYLGSGPSVSRIHQSDHGDTVTMLETPLQAVPSTAPGMSIWRTAQSPSATRGTMTATPTNAATEALTAIAGPKGEPAAGLGAGEEYAFRGSSVPSSSATYYRLDEAEILRLPMITLINSYSDYDADVESMAQQTFSFSPPTVTTATATTTTDANTNNANYDGPCITVTDMDHIEKSNLNRQFLFRPDDVGQAKSTVAAKSIQQFNPALKVVAIQRKVDFSTEKEIFTDEFLQTAASGRDKSTPPIVLAALDSVEARRYLDARCVTNRLAMFESGTQGTKGHTQVVLPGITESYSGQSDPSSSVGAGDGDAIPYCTLKSFPAKAADCVEWAREKFFAQFSLKPRTLDQLLRAFHYSPEELRHALQSLLVRGPPELSTNDPGATNILVRNISTPQVAFFNNRPTTWEECIRLGREKFEKYFHHKALHLLYKFPADKVLEGGEPFWQLPRRKPRPITFDLTNDLHVKFVWYFGRLIAKQMDIQFPSSIQKSLVEEALTDFTPEPYIPSDKEVITDPSRTRPSYAASETVSPIVDDKFQALLKIAIARLGSSDCKLVCHPVEFDKDNDNAGHIDFITAATNLRSAMYGISETDRYEVKRIAGRIIPAMATTTAAVAGLVSLEVLKYICFSATHPGTADVLATNARNNFLNLSLPSFISVQPGPSTTKFLPNNTSFTIWDRWEMELPSKSSTLKQFIETIKSKSGLDVSLITQNCRPIYMTFLPKFQFNLNKPMLSLLDVKPLENYVDLVIAYEGVNGDDDDVEGPPFRLKIPST